MLLTIHLFLLTFICVEYLPVLMAVHRMHAGARKGLRAPGIEGRDGWAVVLRLSDQPVLLNCWALSLYLFFLPFLFP